MGPLPFHMPGHKLGKGIPETFLSEIEKLDVTEIPGMDNLHAPSGVLKEAQELCAEAFGARKTYFLVNGSTVGLHAAIAAVCRPGERLIAGRDSHSSVINGMLLSGVRPYYILPEFSDTFGIHTGYTPHTIEKALCCAPDAVGVLITRPNYYGVCSDIKEIAETVHSFGKLLIVDEAHGAHLAFNSRLPQSALSAGADMCIQSAHKTLPAFTQGAYLHIGSDRVDQDRISYFLDIYQTTSPSYVIMASLDIAREIMCKHGKELLDRLLDSIGYGKGMLYGKNARLLDGDFIQGFEHDSTRIVADVSGLGVTGYFAERLLREQFNLQIEMSDLKNIVCIATVADSREAIESLFTAISKIEAYSQSEQNSNAERHSGACGADSLCSFKGMETPELVLEPAEILNARIERIPLERAEGRVSRGSISPYPPGSALVCPGEILNENIINYLGRILSAGGTVHGIGEDGTVPVIKEIKQRWHAQPE